MKVSDAIKYLQNDYKPDDEIVMAWWDIKAFEGDDIDPEHWAEFVDHVESKKDWSGDQEDISFMYENWKKDYAEV